MINVLLCVFGIMIFHGGYASEQKTILGKRPLQTSGDEAEPPSKRQKIDVVAQIDRAEQIKILKAYIKKQSERCGLEVSDDTEQIIERISEIAKSQDNIKNEIQELMKQRKYDWDSQKAIAKLLIAHNITCDDIRVRSRTIFECAVEEELEFTEFLLKAGANPNIKNDSTPLLFEVNSIQMAALLFKYGADVHATNKRWKNDTLLTFAGYSNQDPERIDFCIEKGLDPLAVNMHNHSPLMNLLVSVGCTAAVQPFIKKIQKFIHYGVPLDTRFITKDLYVYWNETNAFVGKTCVSVIKAKAAEYKGYVWPIFYNCCITIGDALKTATKERKKFIAELVDERLIPDLVPLVTGYYEADYEDLEKE